MIKKIAALLVLSANCLQAQALVSNFEDIKFWAGSGTNRAALLIQWPDNGLPGSVAWGYRWNGSATAQDMIFALAGVITGGPLPSAGSDPRLEFKLIYYGGGLNDYFVDQIRFNQVGLGAGWSAAQRIMPGYDGVDFNALYFRYGTSLWTSASFTLSETGPAGIPLQNGTWVGWVFADGVDSLLQLTQPYAAPAAVLPPLPKPAALVRATNGTAVVSVASEQGFKYQLTLSGAVGGSWTNQLPVLNGTGGTISFTNTWSPGVVGQRFYRVIVSR